MFTYPQKVLFKHCDPAGIVFFPRYFEMMNDCMEVFFADALEAPFEQILQDGGVPTAQISTRFIAPSRHGDQLTLTLVVTRLGKTSFNYAMTATCRDETRFTTEGTIVHVNSDGRPTPWPEAIKDRLANHEDRSQ